MGARPAGYRTLAAALSLGLLGACGFHLRGPPELPQGMTAIHVQATNPATARELRSLLAGGGVRVEPSAAAAPVSLRVLAESTDRRLLAVDPLTGKARAYELAYGLTYQVTRADGSAIIGPETVQLVRDYIFDPDAVIAKSEEEALIFEEMRREAVQQVLRSLTVHARAATQAPHAGRS